MAREGHPESEAAALCGGIQGTPAREDPSQSLQRFYVAEFRVRQPGRESESEAAASCGRIQGTPARVGGETPKMHPGRLHAC
jgi:hypothetical protein